MAGDLAIVPVLNKVDLAMPGPKKSCKKWRSVLGIDPADVLPASGKTGQGVEDVLAADHRACTSTGRRSAGAVASDGLRLALRRIPRRDHLRAGDERHRPHGTEDSLPEDRLHARGARARPVRAAATAVRTTSGRPGRLPDLQYQDAHAGPHRRHSDHRRRAHRPRSLARLPRAEAHGLLRSVIRRTGKTSRSCATP